MNKKKIFDVDKAIILYKNGNTLEYIMKEMNLARQTIKNAFKEHNIKIKSSNEYSKKDIPESIELYNKGMNITQIAKKLNIGETTLYRYFRNNNVTLRRKKSTQKIKYIKKIVEKIVEVEKIIEVEKSLYIETPTKNRINKEIMVTGRHSPLTKITKMKDYKNLCLQTGDKVEIIINVTNRINDYVRVE